MTTGTARPDVSRETLDRLEIFAGLLEKWNPRINLVARSTLADLWTRHIQDSLQVMRCVDGEIDHWADFGSGGGFPGLIVAICAKELGYPHRVTLVESDTRKATFLRTVLREADVAGHVIPERIEEVAPLEANVISARALADLSRLFALASPHLSDDGFCLFPKGANWRSEVQTARNSWQFTYDTIPSVTESNAVILKIKGLSRV
ncbi:16S rRNA (guanine(527)-N(7))-methyltransferase RsmG [Aquicoccus porphyridii]|uniref:16S rRNA (guanine(527)-N(7))-methyltransferase RsmG n=1 Tax=Aquicoccus porphyridii TaxID=1852029 RepID=UPI00273E4F19|nr:16S rRNA (guanine(527)-N(7))-methyltransferase RsmG [Aquicoccus porphyridii]